MPSRGFAVCRVSARRLLSSALVVWLLTGCTIAPPPPRTPVSEDARRAIDLLVGHWHALSDLRALADITLKKGSEEQHFTGVLLSKTPASLRFEAISPFGQPLLLVTVQDARLVAYNAATNEVTTGPATVETAASMLSLPFEPDDLVAVLSGRVVPPKDLRIAEIFAPDADGPSINLIGRYHEQRVWMDFSTGVVNRVNIVGGRTEAEIRFLRAEDGALTGLDVSAGQGYVTAKIRYRSLALNGGVDPERFVLTPPKDAKTHSIR
jgi:outer membrane lipoprotein-sorting protein